MRSTITLLRTSVALGLGLALGAILTSGLTSCSRNNIEAVNLANEGDKSKQTNIDDAISKYEQATQLDPSNHRILWKLALAYHKKEAWADDALTCSKAEKVAPTFATYYYEHGFALKQQAVKGPTTWSEAKGPLEQAIKLDPGLADAYEDLGEVLYHMDDEQGALQNFSKAIEVHPDNLAYYTSLADLYRELGYLDSSEQVLKQGLSFAGEGDNAKPENQPKVHKALFAIHSLLGFIYETKGNASGAISEYEAAKKECGPCNEPGQQIAYFNLGGAYAQATPPRKNEAVQQLQSFQKIVCKGAAAQRYSDQCQQAQEIAKRMGGTLQ
jgi:tetratricopeptide (TPR) repeat protein